MAGRLRGRWLTRFLSDFTLGFSDGLTVPFALTAGLSALGRTETVIYAGLAELCAGGISMGVGGYLSARDELPTRKHDAGAKRGNEDEEELKGGLLEEERAVREYLTPLCLPDSMLDDVVAHTLNNKEAVNLGAGDGLPVSPLGSAFFIMLGYVVGGLIPLTPYLFAATVGAAMRWSIGACLLALFGFGAGKSWLLRKGGWGRCAWEGGEMVVLGGLAAGAAVLCVSLLEGVR